MNVQGGNKHSREVCFGQVKEEIQGKKIKGECSVCVCFFYFFYLYIKLGVVVWLSSTLTSVPEVRVRFPPDAAIPLASECTFARANPCHVRGIGYHHSDTRVWGSVPDIVSGVIVVH